MTTSVVIACYNGEKYILEQMESIRTQTVAPDEVLLCDDRSTDNTFQIVEDYIAAHGLSNWRICKNEVNQGWRVNFAQLCLNATKDIIFLCDQDDIWYPKKLETMAAALEDHSEVQVLVSDLDVKYMSEDVAHYEPAPLGTQPYRHLPLNPKWVRLMRPGCAFAVRREFAQTCFSKYWRPSLAHDRFLWKCAFLADALGHIHEPLFAFRRFKESSTAGKMDSKADFRIIENEIFLDGLSAAMQMCGVDSCVSAAAERTARRCWKLETKRKKFFETKNVFTWLSCLGQIDCYPFAKSWLADLYHICIRKGG